MSSRATAALDDGTLLAYVGTADYTHADLKALLSTVAAVFARYSDASSVLAGISVRLDECADDLDDAFNDSEQRATARAVRTLELVRSE